MTLNEEPSKKSLKIPKG